MQGKRHHALARILGWGVMLGCVMVVFFCLFEPALPTILDESLNAPAMGLAWLWHESGLPPQGEAAFAMPVIFGFAQWFIVGASIGLWRCRRLQRKHDSPTHEESMSEVTRGELKR